MAPDRGRPGLRVASDPGYESRQRLQAWELLRWAGVSPPEEQQPLVLGAAAEVAVDARHDLLVAYRDNSIRYLNYSGAAVVVEGEVTAGLDEALEAWFKIADVLARMVGVWDKPDLPPLPPRHTRILMLTPAGKRFGQGPDEAIRRESPAAAFLDAATRVLEHVTTQAQDLPG